MDTPEWVGQLHELLYYYDFTLAEKCADDFETEVREDITFL